MLPGLRRLEVALFPPEIQLDSLIGEAPDIPLEPGNQFDAPRDVCLVGMNPVVLARGFLPMRRSLICAPAAHRAGDSLAKPAL